MRRPIGFAGSRLQEGTADSGTFASGQVLDGLDSALGTANADPPWRPFIYRRLAQRREYNSAIQGEGNQKRTSTAGKTSAYSPFETASAPYVYPASGKYADVTISSASAMTVQHTLSLGSPVTESHLFHDSGTLTGGLKATGATPANSIKFGAQIAAGGWLASYPDLFQGKEYRTEVSSGGSPLRTVDRVYGGEQIGTVARLCHENTTILDGSPSITTTKLFFYDTDQTGAKLTSYLFGNQTEAFEFDFAGYKALQPLSGGYTQCNPSSPLPTGFARRTRTDYLQNANYVSPTAWLPSLPVRRRVFSAGGQLTDVNSVYDDATSIKYNYAVIQAAYCGAARAERGNLFSVSTSVIPAGAGPNPIVEKFYFDCVGNLRERQDGKLNLTVFGFVDDYVSPPPTPPAPLPSSPTATYARLTSIQLPSGFAVNRKYDFYTGRTRQETDPNGLITNFSYADHLVRLKQVSRSAGQGATVASTTNYTYNDVPQTTAMVTSMESHSDQFGADQRLGQRIGYDALGRQVTSVALGAETIEANTVYDGLGRVYRQCNPAKPGVASQTDGCYTNTFDVLGRVTQRSGPDGSIVRTDYATTQTGFQGTKTTVTDEALNKRDLFHDGLGRLIQVVEAPGVSNFGFVTNYTYDALDNLTDVNQGGQTRHYEYDSLRRLRSAQNPENGTTAYAYDANGNLTSRTDQRGVVTCYGILNGSSCDGSGYDTLDRVTTVSYNDGTAPNFTDRTPPVRHCYDGATYSGGVCSGSPAGQKLRKTAVGNSVSATSYQYDIAGRLLSSSQTVGAQPAYTFQYSSYNNDQLASITYPNSQRVVATCYDANGRVSWVSKDRTTDDCKNGTGGAKPVYANVQSYVPPGGIASMTLGGILETTAFNPRLQPVSIQAGSLLTLGYTYGGALNNGNVQTQTINDGSVTRAQDYTYDPLNRLTVAREDTSVWSQTYVYDSRGNRGLLSSSSDPSLGLASLFVPTTSGSAPFNGNNRWTFAGAGYDNGGNLTDIVLSPNSFHAVYDAENRQFQTTSTVGGTTVVTYGYNGEGRRVSKAVSGGGTTIYAYDAQGTLAQEYSTGGSAETGTQYLTSDHLGSTRLVRTASGGVVSRSDYLPFGQEIPSTWGSRGNYQAVASQTVKFTGKERDQETGLDYFGARYFSGAQGRFTSPDKPFADQQVEDPQSWNLCAYVRNNPLRYIDPTGGACFDNRGASSCGNYILGGLKEVANVPSNIATSINRVIDPAIAWTGFQFGAAPTFQPANVDQAEGMEAAAVVMLASPLAEAGAAKVAGVGRASSAATRTAATTEVGVVYELPPQAASGKPYIGRTTGASGYLVATGARSRPPQWK